MDHSLQDPHELFNPITNFLSKHTEYEFDALTESDYYIPFEIREIPKSIQDDFNVSNFKFTSETKNYGCFGAN